LCPKFEDRTHDDYLTKIPLLISCNVKKKPHFYFKKTGNSCSIVELTDFYGGTQ